MRNLSGQVLLWLIVAEIANDGIYRSGVIYGYLFHMP